MTITIYTTESVRFPSFFGAFNNSNKKLTTPASLTHSSLGSSYHRQPTSEPSRILRTYRTNHNINVTLALLLGIQSHKPLLTSKEHTETMTSPSPHTPQAKFPRLLRAIHTFHALLSGFNSGGPSGSASFSRSPFSAAQYTSAASLSSPSTACCSLRHTAPSSASSGPASRSPSGGKRRPDCCTTIGRAFMSQTRANSGGLLDAGRCCVGCWCRSGAVAREDGRRCEETGRSGLGCGGWNGGVFG